MTVVVDIEAVRQLGLSESDFLESLQHGVAVATLINVGSNAEQIQQHLDFIARAEAINSSRNTEILRMLRDIGDADFSASPAVTSNKIVHGPQRNHKKGKAKKW